MQAMSTHPFLCSIVLSLLFQCGSGTRLQNEGNLTHPHHGHHQKDHNHGGHSHGGTSHGGHGRKRCGYELTRPSVGETSMLKGMLSVPDPNLLGKGKDVVRRDPDRPSYSKLVFKSAWKVSKTPVLQKYEQTVQSLDAKNKDLHIPKMQTDRGAVQVPNGSPNEYLMWHGQEAKYLEHTICIGPEPGDGAFGNGIYFADSATKFDQYVMEDKDGFLRQVLGKTDQVDNQAPEGNLLYGLIFRTYMGHVAEVQRHSYGDGDWFWRDPVTGDEKKTRNGQIPFGADSTKAVAKKEVKLGGKFPNWFNEYLVPSKNQVAAEYIVVYERK